MKIGEFIKQELGLSNLPGLSALDGLAGQTMYYTRFFRDLDQALGRAQSWMPLYFVPIATDDMADFGVHLRPQDVAAGRMPVFKADTFMGVPSLTQVAPSLDMFAYRVLADWEGTLYDDGTSHEKMSDALALANQLWGETFYQPGRHGEFGDYFDQGVREIILQVFGAADDYIFMAVLEKDPAQKRAWLDRGLAVAPDCMYLHTHSCKLYHQLNERERAVRACAQALACYHHTCSMEDLAEFYNLGRDLLQTNPAAFSPLAHNDLTIGQDIERFKWIADFFKAGQIELSAKLLDDMCYDLRNYEDPVVLDFVQVHYQRLGWQWAVALCQARRANVDPSDAVELRGAQSPEWENAVKKTLGI